MADLLAESFGNLSGSSPVLPPAGYPGIAGALSLVAALAAWAAVSTGRRRAARTGFRGAFRPRLAVAAVALSVAGVLCLALAVLSAAERSERRFVSLGGMARPVPSEAAAGRDVEAGSTGRILESAGGWLFVELDKGGAVWLATDQAMSY